MSEELIIEPKDLKGEDGYKNISIRVRKADLEKLDDLSNETNRSRNALINAFIKYGIEHYKIKNKNDK